MKAKSFNALSPLHQKGLLKKDGVYLLLRKECEVDVVLYQLEDFYVEVYFSTVNPMQVRFTAFDDMDGLDKYLSLIDIKSLEPLLK